MSSTLVPVKRQRLHQRVAEEIKRYILEHGLKKGDALPTEMDFAQHLKVNRATVREAIRGLEMIGVLTPRKGGSGYVVGSLNLVEFARHFSFHLQAEEVEFRDLAETRLLLELNVLPLVAERATEQDFSRLQQAIDLLRQGLELEPKDPAICIAADVAFHQALFEASHNRVLANLVGIIKEFFADVRHALFRSDLASAMKRTIREHQAIYDALRRKDVRQAQELMYTFLSVYLSDEKTQSEI